jgi:DNA-binding response OmpR family regulator
MSSLTVLAVLAGDVDPSAVEGALAADDIHVVAFVHGVEDESDPLLGTSADVLLLACGEPSDAALSFVRSACAQQPDRPIVVLACGAENGHVASVFEAGADDLIRVPDGDWWRVHELSEQLTFVVEKAMARRTGTPAVSDAGLGRMVCVLGPKGGIGKTLTASNLTVALAATGASVTVVDVDLRLGASGLRSACARTERSTTSRAQAVRSTSRSSTRSSPCTARARARCSLRSVPTRPESSVPSCSRRSTRCFARSATT